MFHATNPSRELFVIMLPYRVSVVFNPRARVGRDYRCLFLKNSAALASTFREPSSKVPTLLLVSLHKK